MSASLEDELDEITQKTIRHNKRLVRKFLKTCDNLAPQGSAEWLLLRTTTNRYKFGGSEVGSIIGVCPYKTAAEQMLAKLGIVKFESTAVTRWGNFFEDVIRDSLVHRFGGKIRETGTLPGFLPKYLTYSPDGIGVIEKSGFPGILPGDIALYEIKAPSTRQIVIGKIPEYYMSQIQSGMLALPDTKYTVYCETLIKKCTLEQLRDDSSYDKTYRISTQSSKNIRPYIPALYRGIIMLWTKDEVDAPQNYSNGADFNSMLTQYVDARNLHQTVIFFYTDTEAENFLDDEENKKIISALNEKNKNQSIYEPWKKYLKDDAVKFAGASVKFAGCVSWKMFDTNIMQIHRIPNYYNEERIDMIKQASKFLKRVESENSDIEEIKKIVSQYKYQPV